MEEKEYQKHFQFEQDHWWFKGRRKIVFPLLKKYVPDNKELSILDTGCGTGLNMKYLEKIGTVTGIDISPTALDYCRQRGLQNVVLGSVNALPFSDSSFDIITLFGVLYHKDVDDQKAINETFRVLKPGGIAVISTPAMKLLRHRLFRTRHDEAHHTARRHSRKELQKLLEDAGFTIKKISYHTTLLFFPALLFRLANNIIREKESELQTFPGPIDDILARIMYLEKPVIQRSSFPFGMGLIAIARKPQ